MTREFAPLVASQPLFAGLGAETLATIADCTSAVRFAAGSCLFRAGGPADHLYILRAGRVALEVSAPGRGSQAFLTIHPGEIVGLSWLVPPYVWHFDARALDDIDAVAIDARCLRGKLDANHDVGYALMQRFVPVLLERLHAARLQLLDVYGGPR